MRDLILRAKNKKALVDWAKENGLIRPDGTVRSFIDYDEIDVVVLQKATFDTDGNELTPAVIDPRYHVNIRLSGPKFELDEDKRFSAGNYGRSKIVRKMKRDGVERTNARGIRMWRLGDVDIIDPTTVSTPIRVWAGGMHFD